MQDAPKMGELQKFQNHSCLGFGGFFRAAILVLLWTNRTLRRDKSVRRGGSILKLSAELRVSELSLDFSEQVCVGENVDSSGS